MFIGRNPDLSIYGLWTVRQWPGQEELPDTDPAVLAFTATPPAPPLQMRNLLNKNVSYWVAPPPLGNDANDGRQAAPFATLTRAYNVIRDMLDFGGFGVTVNVAHGTYPPFLAVGRCTGQVRPQDLLFTGDVNDSWSCVISATNNNAISVDAAACLRIQGVSPRATGPIPFGFGIAVIRGVVELGPMGWRDCERGFISAASTMSEVNFVGGFAIQTGSVGAFIAENGARIFALVSNGICTNGINFSSGFIIVDQGATIDFSGAVVTGSGITGPKAVATSNGVAIITGATIPGAGTPTASGGQVML